MKNILKLLKNKYIITMLIFIVWVGFLDRNNLVKTLKIRKSVKELKNNKDYYLQEIEKTRIITSELWTDPNTLETFAREEYYMKKSDEDIFLVDEK